MSSESWLELAIAVVALLMMAVAATVEATATLVSRHRLRQLAEEQGRHLTVETILDPKRTLIASLHLVEVIAIATATALLTTMLLREVGTAERILAIAIVGVVFLLLGQALPRALANTRPERATTLLLGLARFLTFAVRPLAAIVNATVRALTRVLPSGGEPPAPAGAEEELNALTINGGDDAVIEANEREMINAVLHLEETVARDIMVPRVDVVAVDETTPPREILAIITRAGHSRLPVYRESIDQIVGVLYAKDLLPFVIGTTEQLPLKRLVRPAYIVPESKRVDDLLTELRRGKVHIAIVVDEYGGTAGLVTIEDILEEIVGEIQDEYDREEAPLVERVRAGEVIVDGRLPLEDVAEELAISFDDDDHGTVAGFVHRQLGRLPLEGEQFETEGLRIEVLSVEGRRVRQLRLISLAAQPGGTPPSAEVSPPGDDAAEEPAAAAAIESGTAADASRQ